MIGETIGRYRVVEKLGEGGGGSVWLAEDPVLGRSVAIKLLPERMADSPEAKERLLREARAACKLHHSSIATVYEAGEDEGRVWVAFEHVDGETVAQRVKREGPLPVDEALRIAREAAEALGHAHASGILHRDVTAGNIMLHKSGRVKLVDFGLAVPEGQSRKTRTMSTPATIGYVAPEVVQGESGDRRADLYGLGAVLYEMLTGHLPFERDRAEAVLYAVVNEEPTPLRQHRPELPAEVEAIVLRAIAKEPAERFADCGALRRALEGRAPAAREGGENRQRRRLLRNVLVALAVAAAAFAAWEIFGPDSPRFDSVAVLPLSLPGDNAEEIAYLATGLGDALAGRLACVSDLRVTPWVTSRRYPPSAMPIQDIGTELNVESLVAGELVEEGGTLKITFSLLRADNGEPVWSATFEDSRNALLELQDVIGLAVANGIRGRLTPEQRTCLAQGSGTPAEAYDQYLRGAAALETGTREGIEEALARFETALAIDPHLADAWVGAGGAHVTRFWRGWEGTPAADLAERSFRRALEIDPESVSAIRGLMRLMYMTGRSDECLLLARELRRTGGFSPEGLLGQAEGLTMGGLPEDAIPLLQAVNQQDPANLVSHYWLVIAYSYAGDAEGTIRAGEQYLGTFGESWLPHCKMGGSHLCHGDDDLARLHYEAALELGGDDGAPWMYVQCAFGLRKVGSVTRASEAAELGIRDLEARLSEGVPNSHVNNALVRLYSLVADTARVITFGHRVEQDTVAPDLYGLAAAYVEVGKDEEASRILLELTRKLGADPGSGLETARTRQEFLPLLFRGCNVDLRGTGFLSHLPAYEGLITALHEEEQRRRALYGGGG